MKKKLLWVAVALIVVGVVAVLLIPSTEEEAKKLDKAGAGAARQVIAVQKATDDRAFLLNSTNTVIDFSCAKTLAGKTLSVQGGWSGDFNSRLTGQAVVGADGTLKQISVEIDMASVWSEHDILTDALLKRGFFLVNQHPKATFTSTSIKPLGATGSTFSNATHSIEGNFKLNGIEKSISFPAILDAKADRLTLKSAFSLDRKAFNANFVDSIGFGLLTDDNISHEVAIKVKVEALADGKAAASMADVDTDEQEVSGAVDASKLPPAFAEIIAATQVKFDMVLMPGDPAAGIKPFYLGKREVTWDEFMPWMTCEDVKEKEQHGVLRAKKLRPSMSYIDVTRGYGTSGYPALSMSRLSAELYCKWLGKQTGHKYRLPTEAEWKHAWVLGGGSLTEPPVSDDAAAQVATFEGNSFDDFDGKYKPRKCGSKAPNTLGLHDMAGNVCEWVTGTGEERVVLGGNYTSTRKQLGYVCRLVEVPAWNMNYPNEPKSIWWFVDAEWTGLRLVCVPTPDFKTP